MYLSFATVSAIFLGGVIRWAADSLMVRRGMDQYETVFRANVGTLLASGMIAGEALVSILLAILVNLHIRLPQFGGSGLGGLAIIGAVSAVLIAVPLRARRPEGA